MDLKTVRSRRILSPEELRRRRTSHRQSQIRCQRASAISHKMEFIEKLGGCCKNCGQKNWAVLEFHHRNPAEKKQALSRKAKESRNRNRTKQKLAALFSQKTNIINDWQNKVAKTIACSPFDVIVLENLKLANMTKAPKPKPSPLTDGTYKPNSASAKAGLNAAMLRLALGGLSDKIQWRPGSTGKPLSKFHQ